MREESHLEDMRSAIRGDFERLAERRGGQELMRADEDDLDAAADDELPETAPAPAEESLEPPPAPDADPVLPVAAAADVPSPESEDEGAEEPAEEVPVEEPRDEEVPRRSFLDRLLGR